jgi:hypothetical protein
MVVLFLPALFGVFQSCVNDDLAVCGLKVHFRLTRNLLHTDRLVEEITKVNLYVFDAVDGTLVDQYTVEQNPMPQDLTLYLNLQPGAYDFIAWGDLKDSYELSAPAVVGVTTKSELEVLLIRGSSVIADLPSNLYYGSINNMQVTSHDLQMQRDTVIDFIKNTKEITVVAHGLAISGSNRTAGTADDCGISANNGTLKFDNYTIGNDTLQYIPEAGIDGDTLLISHFAIVRDHNSSGQVGGPTSGGNPRSRVTLTRSSDGNPAVSLLDLNLYPLLVAAAAADPLAVVGGDLPVDIKDKYQIDVFFDESYGTVEVFIEGWKYNYTEDNVRPILF